MAAVYAAKAPSDRNFRSSARVVSFVTEAYSFLVWNVVKRVQSQQRAAPGHAYNKENVVRTNYLALQSNHVWSQLCHEPWWATGCVIDDGPPWAYPFGWYGGSGTREKFGQGF